MTFIIQYEVCHLLQNWQHVKFKVTTLIYTFNVSQMLMLWFLFGDVMDMASTSDEWSFCSKWHLVIRLPENDCRSLVLKPFGFYYSHACVYTNTTHTHTQRESAQLKRRTKLDLSNSYLWSVHARWQHVCVCVCMWWLYRICQVYRFGRESPDFRHVLDGVFFLLFKQFLLI